MQSGSTGIGYGLKYQARCIADVKADSGVTSFLVGTLSLKEENEVHLIQLSSSGSELTCEGLYSHPQEIWDLASCPFDSRIFSTVFASGGVYGAAVWDIPEIQGNLSNPQLGQVASLDGHSGKIRKVLWWPSGKHDKLITIDEENLFVWSLDSSTRSAKVVSQESAGTLHYLSGGAWNPHDLNLVSVISESSIQCCDLRTMKKACSIDHGSVRNIDYNPRKQNIIVTAEDESGIRFWDFRMPSTPLKELPGHAHWTWCVQHNPEYDELVLSSGTDSAVNLWLASGIGTEDFTSDRAPGSRQTNPLLHSYSDYDDSVFGIAWSSHEPCVFASLAYDGRVVVESVKPYIPKR